VAAEKQTSKEEGNKRLMPSSTLMLVLSSSFVCFLGLCWAGAVDALAVKLDTTTMMLLGTSVGTIVLVVVAIALVYMGKRKPAA